MKDRPYEKQRATWHDIAMPFVLIAAGVIVAAGVHVGIVSLDRVQNLWPAALFLAAIVDIVPVGGLDRES